MPLALTWNPDQRVRVPTADGAVIALGRYHPRGQRRFIEPILLAHGLGANRFDLDFDEHYSWARHLARRGFETWVLEMRGRGHAGHHRKQTSFDTQAEYDVAAALREIGRKVLWVGHSKGGLAAYAHLARNPRAPISAIVAVGSPVRLTPHWGLQAFAKASAPLFHLPVIPLRAATRLATLWGLPPEPVGSHLVNRENLEPRVIRQAIYNVSADVYGGVARQFARWAATGRFDGEDGLDYFAALQSLRLPVLLVAGTEDKLAPPSAVLAAASQLAGPTQTLVLSGYGHGDLSVGRNVPHQVLPQVTEFLERVATPVRR